LQTAAIPIILFFAAVIGLGVFLLLLGRVCNPSRMGRVKEMPYESGMDPIHDTRRRFDIRFHLLAIAFLVFDVELLFLYPWAVALHNRPERIASVGSNKHIGDSVGLRSQTAPVGEVPPTERVQGSGFRESRSDLVGEVPATSRDLAPLTTSAAAPVAAAVQLAAEGPIVRPAFVGGFLFLVLLTLGFVYDWRKGVFRWR
jgi:NADH:ubiquinone oxidoreductase subunit 3 (subunit A)